MRFQLPTRIILDKGKTAHLARLSGIPAEQISAAFSRRTDVLDEESSFEEAYSRFRQLPEQSSGKTIAFLLCLNLAQNIHQAKTLFLGLPPDSELRYFAIAKMAENLNLESQPPPSPPPHRPKRRSFSPSAVTGNTDRQG